jgi:hypothetical protein
VSGAAYLTQEAGCIGLRVISLDKINAFHKITRVEKQLAHYSLGDIKAIVKALGVVLALERRILLKGMTTHTEIKWRRKKNPGIACNVMMALCWCVKSKQLPAI